MIDMVETLKKARDLIADPAHWTQGVSARTKNGVPCNLSDGYSFCAIGAIDRALYGIALDPNGGFPHSILRKAIRRPSIVDWNDRSSHETVLAGFDAAIALAENL